MKLVGPSVLLAVSLVFAGCATRTAPNPVATTPGATTQTVQPKHESLTSLAGTSWALTELDGSIVSKPKKGWEEQSLQFDAAGLLVTGNGGVNRFGGRYNEKGRVLFFGPLAMTRRAGPPEQMDAEQLYTRVLSRVVAWRQDGDKLVLIGPGERGVAVFKRVGKTTK